MVLYRFLVMRSLCNSMLLCKILNMEILKQIKDKQQAGKSNINNNRLFRWLGRYTTLTKSVGIPGLATLVLLTVLTGCFPRQTESVIIICRNYIFSHLSWMYVLLSIFFFSFICYLSFSRIGNIKLGRDNSKPQYSTFSWVAMLFAAGMGIGLMFYGIGEPMAHYAHPALENTVQRAKEAQLNTFFHWGFHAWTIYAVMGLILSYFSFRYNLPLSIRSGLYPILKEKINGPVGAMVDIFALCCTFFSISTSLGLGALQLASGLEALGVIEKADFGVEMVIIIVVAALSVTSALLGMNKGVKRLSQLNLGLAGVLMLFVLFTGPTLFLTNAFCEGIGNYLTNLVGLTFNTFAFEEEGVGWFRDWTVMYWAWWIAWAPFVGLFIARISKGRTIREFCLGVIVIPSIFVFLWMTIFGNGAIWIDKNIAGGVLSQMAHQPEVLLFRFFDYLPLGKLLTCIALMLISIFFITSADSGILVINSLTSGNRKSPAWQKIFWGVLLVIVTLLLLHAGGLQALQTTFLVTALPFGLVMLLLCYCLWRAIKVDVLFHNYKFPYGSQRWNGSKWKERLDQIVSFSDKKDIYRFMDEIVVPAFNDLKERMDELGIEAIIRKDKHKTSWMSWEILIPHNSITNFKYGVMVEKQTMSDLLQQEDNMPDTSSDTVYIPVTYYNSGRRGHDIQYLSKEELISDILREYERFINIVLDVKNELLISDKSDIEIL